LTTFLRRAGEVVNRKRVQRLMRRMGIEAIYPRPRTTRRNVEHRVFPYLLRGVEIVRPNQVWSTDITYVPMPRGYMYLTAVMDWFSRYVLAWSLSNSLEGTFCLEALDEALGRGTPEIFNTDQGSQYTAAAFTGRLLRAGVAVSMDGRGRALDNAFIERLWRTVKYEWLYLHGFDTVDELQRGLRQYFAYYNQERFHQRLENRTPAEVYEESLRTQARGRERPMKKTDCCGAQK
jgi:putative transposase